ncbi:MAG TPA: ATPase, T2SS/T4P/T4SS family [Candidatus Rifleibacterium sp.]|nr:ATPase, T2SS/T4P/T4SS family [Candidatus Rifleibacterium sp.]HPT46407.1 ATPase, T2SS/T4P/T4SS family [Candidatus Rifleibacterium sp.]
MDIRKMIEKVKTAGGTELHLKVGARPLMRRNKFLRHMDMPVLHEDDMTTMIKDLLNEDDRQKFARLSSYEANFFGRPPCNFRLTLFHSQQKPVALIKIISSKIPTLEEIRFPDALTPIIDARKGMFIIAGPARSGISTSLAAMVERINQLHPRHVLIIEDPIEFNFEPKRCRISQRQFRKDINQIEQGINFAKRMDVDVLVIGDLKREIPFRNIIEYVAGGHFVILSMQTLGIVSTLEKFIFSFPEPDREYVCQVLAETLQGICSQALIADMGGKRVVPVHETLVVNSTAMSIIQKGKVSQLEPNIMSAGPGSQLFAQVVQKLYLKNDLERTAGDDFLDFYRGTRG